MISIVKQLDHGKSKQVPLNGYPIYHLTGGEIFSEGIHNAQFSSDNVSLTRA